MTDTTQPSSGPASQSAARRTVIIGTCFALGCALIFGGLTTFARISYDAGSTPQTAIFLRFFSATLIFPLAAIVTSQSLRLKRGDWGPMALAIPAWSVANFAYLGAVLYIPVSLAGLIFFTFPLLVALASAALERRWPARREILLLLGGFSGLALALGPDFHHLDPLGIFLAFCAACALVVQMLAGQRLLKSQGLFAMLSWVNVGGLLAAGAMLLIFGGWAWPTGSAEVSFTFGTIMLVLATIGYVVALAMQMTGVRLIGAPRTALFMNLEPVLTIGFGAVLLSEALSAQQYLGAALVIFVLFLAARQKPAT
ncbi:EamA family transporter [Rhodovibrionaceae bacterium A322]